MIMPFTKFVTFPLIKATTNLNLSISIYFQKFIQHRKG